MYVLWKRIKKINKLNSLWNDITNQIHLFKIICKKMENLNIINNKGIKTIKYVILGYLLNNYIIEMQV